REPDHLVLDGRAVPRSAALDLAAIHGSPVKICPDDLVNGRVRGRDVAGDLRHLDGTVRETERPRRTVPVLDLELGEVNGAAIEPAWGAGLEAGKFEAEPGQAVRKLFGRVVPSAAAGGLGFPRVHQRLEEGTGGEDDGPGAVNSVAAGDDASNGGLRI